MNQATLPQTREKFLSLPRFQPSTTELVKLSLYEPRYRSPNKRKIFDHTKNWTQVHPASRIVTIWTTLPCLKQVKNFFSLPRFEPRTTELVELSLYEPCYPASRKTESFVPTKIWTQDHPASRIVTIWTMLPCLKQEKKLLSIPRF